MCGASEKTASQGIALLADLVGFTVTIRPSSVRDCQATAGDFGSLPARLASGDLQKKRFQPPGRGIRFELRMMAVAAPKQMRAYAATGAPTRLQYRQKMPKELRV